MVFMNIYACITQKYKLIACFNDFKRQVLTISKTFNSRITRDLSPRLIRLKRLEKNRIKNLQRSQEKTNTGL